MSKNSIKSQLKNIINSNNQNCNFVVYDNDLDLASTQLIDYILSFKHIFTPEIIDTLNTAYKLITSLYPVISGDVVEQFSVIVYEDRGHKNGRK